MNNILWLIGLVVVIWLVHGFVFFIFPTRVLPLPAPIRARNMLPKSAL